MNDLPTSSTSINRFIAIVNNFLCVPTEASIEKSPQKRGRKEILTPLQQREIYFDNRPFSRIAADYEVSRTVIKNIKQKDFIS